MIMNDKKKIQSILVSKRDPKTGEETRTHGMKPESDSSEESGLHSAAEDIIAAVHSKSAHKVKDAMKSFILQHGNLVKTDEE